MRLFVVGIYLYLDWNAQEYLCPHPRCCIHFGLASHQFYPIEDVHKSQSVSRRGKLARIEFKAFSIILNVYFKNCGVICKINIYKLSFCMFNDVLKTFLDNTKLNQLSLMIRFSFFTKTTHLYFKNPCFGDAIGFL